MVKKAGLQTHSYNMVGIPYETKESIKKTIEINRICRPDFIAVSIFNAYQGTEIYEICKRNGWLRMQRGQSYFQTTNVKHPNFSLNELIKIRNNFGYNVFKDYSYNRALIELFDKRFLRHRMYLKIRSLLIRKGIKKLL